MSTLSLPTIGAWPDDYEHTRSAETVIYYIDADDQIIAVNEAWTQFAVHNSSSHLTLDYVQSASLWAFIADQDTRLLYKHLFARIRMHNQPITVPFRCDSPAERRFMQLTMTPMVTGGIRFVSQVLRVEAREPQPWLDLDIQHSQEWIEMCSWCKRVRNQASRWIAIETAVASMRLFETIRPPQISHSICPGCVARIEQELSV